MSNVYENKHYTVQVVKATLEEPFGIDTYGIINKATRVREGEFLYFPQVVQYADQLSNSILEWENSLVSPKPNDKLKVVDIGNAKH